MPIIIFIILCVSAIWFYNYMTRYVDKLADKKIKSLMEDFAEKEISSRAQEALQDVVDDRLYRCAKDLIDLENKEMLRSLFYQIVTSEEVGDEFKKYLETATDNAAREKVAELLQLPPLDIPNEFFIKIPDVEIYDEKQLAIIITWRGYPQKSGD